jgi:hypothetical protein
MRIGNVISWQRTCPEEDIRLFAKLSGDQGEHHHVFPCGSLRDFAYFAVGKCSKPKDKI